DGSHGVADGRAEGQSLLALLEVHVRSQGGEDILEVGGKVLAQRSSDGTNGTSSSGLNAKILVGEKLAQGREELLAVGLGNILVLGPDSQGVQSTAYGADDADILLVVLLRRGLEIL